MPCWWIPASCEKAFSPITALLRGIGCPVMLASSRLTGYNRLVCTPVLRLKNCERVASAITTSSSEQLPARSPMPLIVHSIWRAPATTAVRLLATAMPRSSWQCTERQTLSMPRTFWRIAEQLAEFIGHRVADGVGNVDGGRTGLDGRFDHLRQEIQLGA